LALNSLSCADVPLSNYWLTPELNIAVWKQCMERHPAFVM